MRAFKNQMEKVNGLFHTLNVLKKLPHKIENTVGFATKVKDDPIALLGIFSGLAFWQNQLTIHIMILFWTVGFL
jgi:hypothetical protein